MREWRANHPDYGKKWKAEHPEFHKQYYQEHKIEYAERGKQWSIEYPLYSVWHSMKQRCYDQTRKNYKWYGGRGITICNEWLDYKTFEKWALENGWNKLLTIDRIDNNGNYEPSNCHFILREDNSSKGNK